MEALKQVDEPIIDDSIALTGCSLQAPAVEDRDSPILIADQSLFLKDACHLGDPRMADMQYSSDMTYPDRGNAR